MLLILKRIVMSCLKVLSDIELKTTRAGIFKPRTSPYDFQGVGSECYPWLLKTADKYGIKLIATEVVKAEIIGELRDAVEDNHSSCSFSFTGGDT